MTVRNQDHAKLLSEVLDVVVRTVRPRRVYAFGSSAAGTTTADSDIDLLVVVATGMHRRKTAMTLYRALLDVGTAVDIVVVTEDDVIVYREDPGLILKEAIGTGKLLYAA